MFPKSAVAKIWILAALFFLLFWIARLIPDSVERFYNIVFVSWNYYNRIVVGGSMYTMAAVGNFARIIGVLIGIASLFAVWKNENNLPRIRKWVAAALSLETFYYACLIPSAIWLFALANQGTYSYAWGVSYLLQIVFTVPFLAALAFKLFKQGGNPRGPEITKWVGLAFVGYVLALWANTVIKVAVDKIIIQGVQIFTDLRLVEVLSAVILMSLAAIFAFAWGRTSAKQSASAKTWLGLSLTMIGLFYVIHVVTSYFLGKLSEVWLIDIWCIPMLGLGLTLLVSRKQATAL